MYNKIVFLGPILAICVLIWSEVRVQKLQHRIQVLEQSQYVDRTQRSTLAGRMSKERQVQTDTVREITKNGYSSSTKFEKQKQSKNRPSTIIQPQKEDKASIDLKDPDVQEALHTFLEEREQDQKEVRRAEGVGKYLDYVEDKIDSFAQDNDLSASLKTAVMTEIQVRTQEYVQVEYAAEDGELDWTEAKPELTRIKEQGKANLIELLGEEEYEAFEQHVWGRK